MRFKNKLICVLMILVLTNVLIIYSQDSSIFKSNFDNGYSLTSSIHYLDISPSSFSEGLISVNSEVQFYFQGTHFVGINIPFSYFFAVQKNLETEKIDFQQMLNTGSVSFFYCYYKRLFAGDIKYKISLGIPDENLFVSSPENNGVTDFFSASSKQMREKKQLPLGVELNYFKFFDPVIVCFSPYITYTLWNSKTKWNFDNLKIGFSQELTFNVNYSISFVGQCIPELYFEDRQVPVFTNKVALGVEHFLDNNWMIKTSVLFQFVHGNAYPGISFGFSKIGVF